MMDSTLSIEDVANLLKYSKKTIYKLVKTGELKAFKVGKCFRFDVNDINNWMKDKKIETRDNLIAAAQNKSILFVEDDEDIRSSFVKAMNGEGYNILTAKDPIEALNLVKGNNFQLIITDLNMPKMNGVEFIANLREKKINSKIIIITGFSDKESAIFALKNNVFDYIEKPFEMEKLESIIKNALKPSI